LHYTNLFFASSYAALGLVHTLNSRTSGGSEIVDRHPTQTSTNDNASTDSPQESGSVPCQSSGNTAESSATGASHSIPSGFGKLIRDASGKVVGVEMSDEAEEISEQSPDSHVVDNIEMDVETQEPGLPQRDVQQWVTDLGQRRQQDSRSNDNVVQGKWYIRCHVSMFFFPRLFPAIFCLLCCMHNRCHTKQHISH
jgi:nucleolar protein 16